MKTFLVIESKLVLLTYERLPMIELLDLHQEEP